MPTATETAEKKYTLEEYFAWEEKSVEKYEFINGKIIAMPGAAADHNIIAANVIAIFKNSFKKESKRFYVMGSDMKIYLEAYQHVRYPDAVVICEKLLFHHGRRDIIINPLVIVEVLSGSTESFDRGQKFDEYQTLPSFKEYVLIRQDQPNILTFFREEPDLWRTQQCRDLQQILQLKSIPCVLDLTEVYEGVEWANV